MTVQQRARALCAQLRAVNAAATKGRWEADKLYYGEVMSIEGPVCCHVILANARAIALTHNSQLALVEVVEGIAQNAASAYGLGLLEAFCIQLEEVLRP